MKEEPQEGRLALEQSDVLRGTVLLPARFAQTVVSPYCVRRAAKAPVSTPLAWSEVRPTLDPSEFNLGNFDRRLVKKDALR
jgi:hypothetical protein